MASLSNVDSLQKDTEEIQVEKVASPDAGQAAKDVDNGMTEEEKRIAKRATYSISAIDRINISAARIAGMDAELGFQIADRYSIALLVFFVTYFLFEIPSNIVLRKVGAANWLAFLCMSWGLATFGAGFAKKWTDIVICRLLLGLFEAGFFPGSVYLISCFYTRFEVQKRLAAFYSINLSGRNGWLGWRWIFIINGAMTMFLAVLGRILIVDFPDKVHKSRFPFLAPAEVQSIQAKLERDRRDAEYDELTMSKFVSACKRWELWAYAMKFFAVTTIVYALAFFIPIILQGMGYSVGMTFLLSAPPAVAAVPWIMVCSWAADKWHLRAPFVILQCILGIVGLMIVAYAQNNGARYFGIFMGLAGANANIPTVLAWQANNIRGQSLRMVASGFQIAFGALGGIYASTVFMQKEAPMYRTGLWAVTGAQLYLVVSTVGMTYHYWRQNKKASRGEVVLEEMESFRYTY
ncbi:hypothetical protein E8E13_001601 [Curvularia kusanoi]|uniref:Uncharacterized protein n=1 Tax=Curvularia kusanoi TaxID=90978 RepID=A0A9P4W9H7_CURKU|nr:hypothetical protein E8E13_001601 [Curvularia kusanoi]